MVYERAHILLRFVGIFWFVSYIYSTEISYLNSKSDKSMQFNNLSHRNFYCEKRIYAERIFYLHDLSFFCNQFGKEIKRVFYLIHTFTLQFCCSSPTIKTHIISLQSVINNMYTSHLDRYEGKKKEISMWKYA